VPPEIREDDSTKRKRPEAEPPASLIPIMFFILEDPHNNGPQEYKDTTNGEEL